MRNSNLTIERDLMPIPFKKIIADMERSLILQAMTNNRNNQFQAAKQLGISRTKLIYKLKEYLTNNRT